MGKDYSDQLNSFSDNFYEARKILLHQDPFHAQMLYQCAIEMTDDVGTISIREEDSCVYIVYSEKWVNSVTPEEVVEAIKHVLTHLIFGHLTNPIFKGKEGEPEDKKMGKAEDLAINTTLDKNKLPEGFETPDKYKFPEDLSTYDYYNRLPDEPKCKSCGGSGKCKGDGNSKQQGEGEGNGNDSGKDPCPNCQGSGNSKGKKSGDNHDYMTSTVSKSQLKNQVKQMVQQAHKKSGGRMPSNTGDGMKRAMAFLLQPSEIPWNVILRNFVSFSSKVKRESTWKRPNRRYGEDFQGKKKIQTLHILVTIDESGSVADNEWKQFVAEIDAIHKSKMATITICKYTAKVEKVFEYTNIEEVMQERFYGGTCFQPFFDLAETLKPDCVVALTDGYNSEGDNLKYSRFGTVLFCLTPDGRENKNGKSIHIKKINEETEMFW